MNNEIYHVVADVSRWFGFVKKEIQRGPFDYEKAQAVAAELSGEPGAYRVRIFKPGAYGPVLVGTSFVR